MATSMVRFLCFPQTEPPPPFVPSIVEAFKECEASICTSALPKGLTSDEVLQVVGPRLAALGFQIEKSKKRAGKINRPVFYGENGKPALNYQIDAYNETWRCGLEIEAGRGWMGNAVYRTGAGARDGECRPSRSGGREFLQVPVWRSVCQ